MSDVTFRVCANHSSTTLLPCEPWSLPVGEIPPSALESKTSWVMWCKDPSTSHSFYTAAEGINPDIRCNEANPLRVLHAFVADYDAKIEPDMFARISERCPAEFKPSWVSKTRFSGGCRIVWLFEAPLVLDNKKLRDAFLKHAAKELRLLKILPGLDEVAWQNPYLTFEIGTDWKPLEGKPIPTNVLNFWLTEASRKVDFRGLSDVKLPIEEVAAEVERQFPNVWQGPFEVGARGCCFFDGGKNPTSTIITEDGCICFSRDKLFYSWEEILGRAFVQKHQADKIGAAVAEVWYDGKHYYRKAGNVWQTHSKEDFVIWLKVRHGMDASKNKGETASEIDRTLVYVQENRRVSGVAPHVFNPEELIFINGQKFLNCSAVKAMAPSEMPQKWGQDFPWLAQFLDTCFDPPEHLGYFLSWWKHFHGTAYQGDLKKGLALFLAGPAERGKTLLSRIVGDSVGGAADASDYLSSETSFNKELLEVGLWNIDDGVAANDPAAHARFSEMVKRTVANPAFNYHAKYKDSQRVSWHGRVIVTLNSDATSLRMLPSLDDNTADKLLILKFSDAPRVFPEWNDLRDIIATELPYLLRWMTDWKPAPHLLGTARLGTASLIHPDLRNMSLHVGGVGDLLEIVDLWKKRNAAEETYAGGVWEGTASALIVTVSIDDGLRQLMSKYTARQLGRKLAEASRIPNSGIEICDEDHRGSGNRYRIRLSSPFDPAPPSLSLSFAA